MSGDFRSRLRKAIAQSGLTVKEVSKASGIKKMTIDNWIGIHPTIPKVTDAVAVATILHTTVEYLVTGKAVAGWQPPRQIAPIVEDLLILDESGRNAVATLAHGLAEQVRIRAATSGDG
jgi:transcriptional regulator with XRE-family HTH domain